MKRFTIWLGIVLTMATTALLLSACGPLYLQRIQPNKSLDLEFSDVGDGMAVTGYSRRHVKNGDRLVAFIPRSYKGKPVVAINRAFAGCSNLISINIPDSVTSIGEYAFSVCSGLTSITIPDSVTSIGGYAFYDCSGLISIIIPDSVTSIGDGAFYGCSELTSVTIPDSVTSIGEDAFSGCSRLNHVVIGANVRRVASRAFEGCDRLSTVFFMGDSEDWDRIVIQMYNRDLVAATRYYYSETEPIEKGSFWHYVDGVPTEWEGTSNYSAQQGTQDFQYALADGKYTVTGYIGSDTEVEIPAFYQDKLVTSIGDGAFSGCSELTSITIPEGVISIGQGAFYNCTQLISIVLPRSIAEIGGDACCYCDRLNAVFYRGTFEEYISIDIDGLNRGYIDDALILYSATQPTEAGNYWHYVDGVPTVWEETAGPSAQSGTQGLQYYLSLNEYHVSGYIGSDTEVVVPAIYQGKPVTAIGNRAFESCSGLTSITIPNSVNTICDHAFSRCSGLTSITIPNSVTYIGEYAFYECTGLTTVTFAEGSQLTTIWDHAFYGCTGLTSITIPASVTYIREFAFYNCSRLYDVDIPGSVTDIWPYAFSGCSALPSISIPDSMTTIGEGMLQYCFNLTAVFIPDSVTSIRWRAFDYCRALRFVLYKGTSAQWKSIDIMSGNTALLDAICYYYSATQPTEAGNYWHYVDGVPTPWK